MTDVNKKNRNTMWIVLLASIISIPLFQRFDNKQISEQDLVTISNLTVTETPYYNSGKRPLIGIKVQETARTLVVNLEELECVDKEQVIRDLKPGDKINVSILREKMDDFYQTTFIGRFQKIYGLYKSGQDYIELECRNNVANEKTKAFTMASISSGLLSFVFAVLVYKPREKNSKVKQKKFDAFWIICVCWLLVAILFRVT